MRILVAEDNSINRRVMTQMLANFGYRADLASNGLEAVAAAHRQSYDLIFMDVQMPVLDGLMATREIRKRTTSTRIVAMTATALEENREECLAAGMNDYLTKPVTPESLAAGLRRSWVELGETRSGDQ
jgi:CheY-like chemotaxis protein